MHILSQILVVLDQAKYQIRPGHICILINTVLNMYMCYSKVHALPQSVIVTCR